VLVPERFLKRMKSVFRSQAFNRRDCCAVRLDREAGTRFDGDTVKQYRTRAALARVASDFCSGDSAEVANEMNEKLSGFDLTLILPTIHL